MTTQIDHRRRRLQLVCAEQGIPFPARAAAPIERTELIDETRSTIRAASEKEYRALRRVAEQTNIKRASTRALRLARLLGRYRESRSAGTPKLFTGQAVVYNSWSVLLYGSFRERIAPGAFDKSLRSDLEVFATIDHDPARLLGRTSSGTLRLRPDSDGISVEVDVADYSYARDLRIAVDRQDIKGMSMIMDVLADRWERVDGAAARTVTEANLYEVSFVSNPAYEKTSVSLRSSPLSIAMRRRLLRMAEAM